MPQTSAFYDRYALFGREKAGEEKRVSMAVGTVRKPPAVFHGFHSHAREKRERWLSRSGGLPPLFGSLFSPSCGKANEIRKIFVGRENQLREIVYRETVNTEHGSGKGFIEQN